MSSLGNLTNALTPVSFERSGRRLNLDEELQQEWINDLKLLTDQAIGWARLSAICGVCGGVLGGVVAGCVMWMCVFRKPELGKRRLTMLAALRRFRFCSEHPKVSTAMISLTLLGVTALAAWSVASRAVRVTTAIDPGLAGQSATEFGMALLQKLGELTDAIKKTVYWKLQFTNPSHSVLNIQSFKGVIRVGGYHSSREVATMKTTENLRMDALATHTLVLEPKVSSITAVLGAGSTLINTLFNNLLLLRAEIEVKGHWDSDPYLMRLAAVVPFDKDELPPYKKWPSGALEEDDGAKAKKALVEGMRQYHRGGAACIKFDDLQVRSSTMTWAVAVLVCVVANIALVQSCLVCACCAFFSRSHPDIGKGNDCQFDQLELTALPPSSLFVVTPGSNVSSVASPGTHGPYLSN